MIRVGIECESIENDSWGIARMIHKLLEEIARRPELANEFKFFLYFKSSIPDHPYLDNPIFEKKIIGVPSFSLYYYVFLPVKLWFEKLDAMYFPNYMLPILFQGKSIVTLTQDVYFESISKNIPWRHRLAYRIFCRWAAWQATKIMAISEYSKRHLEAIFNIEPGRISVNHLGIDKHARETSDEKGNYILFAAQAFPRRHLKETLLAFEKIAPQFPDLEFKVVAIDKYSLPVIKDLIIEINNRLDNKRIHHTERVSDEELASLMAHAKVFTYISSEEAFGLSPLEALAFGAMPVVADNELTKELFGDNAFFVKDTNSVDEIAQVLTNALTDSSQQTLITAAMADIVNRFTWKAHAERFLNMVRSITFHA